MKDTSSEVKTVRLVLDASEIPENAEVCKVTGEVVYTLRRSITVYPVPGSKPEDRIVIPAVGNQVFLVGERGSINAHAGKLVWIVDYEELHDWVRQKLHYVHD